MLIKQIDRLQEKETIQFLKKNPIDITSLVDQAGNSLAHLAIINPRLKKLQIYFDYIQKNYNDKLSDFSQCINKKLMNITHLACSQKDIKFVKFLMEKKINFRSHGANGLKVTHLAAKNNLVQILEYLRSKGFSFQQQDNAQAKPLHWAAYAGAVQSVQYLIGCNIGINDIDKDGNSCLHLACSKGHSDVIKILLINGCKQRQNKLGKYPEQLCKQSLRYIFKSPNILQRVVFYYNYRFPMRRVDRSYRIVFLFWLIFIYIFLITYLLGLNFLQIKVSQTIINLQIIYVILNFCNFLLHVSLSFIVKLDPVPPLIETEFLKLLENKDQSICYYCRNIKPNRTKHCQICRKCVRIYDHHCPWINTCVGRGNLRFFILFLFVTFANCFISTSILITVAIIRSSNLDAQQIVIYVSFLPCALSIIFLGGLFYVQINNFLFNLTTYQRFSNKARKKRQSLLSQDQFAQPHRSIRNCLALCSYNEEQDE